MSWGLLYSIDLLAIMLFAASYYRRCLRKGYRGDIWHAQLFLYYIFPYLVMLFFARNELNAVIVGRDFGGIVAATPTVFLLVILGYISLLVGGGLWNIHLGLGIRKAAARVLAIGPRCSIMLLSSPDLLVFLSMLCLSAQSLILAAYFLHDGFGFNLRAYTFTNPGIRPFAQISSLSSIVIASHCLARYIERKEHALLVCHLLLTLGLLFFGQRGDLILVYLNVVLCYVVSLRRRISLWRIGGLMIAALVIILYLGNAREGVYSVGEFLSSVVFLFLYGNNFTDLRDFSWMYTNWNHELWLGKTYLAGFGTFLPRFASDFRATWSFGVATGWTVGLDTDLHPGLKPGQYGESFFNFGWPGVIAVGLIYGIILRRVDTDVKLALEPPQPSIMKAFSSTMLLSVAGCFNCSLNVPFFYALCGMYCLAWVYLKMRSLFFPRLTAQAEVA